MAVSEGVAAGPVVALRSSWRGILGGPPRPGGRAPPGGGRGGGGEPPEGGGDPGGGGGGDAGGGGGRAAGAAAREGERNRRKGSGTAGRGGSGTAGRGRDRSHQQRLSTPAVHPGPVGPRARLTGPGSVGPGVPRHPWSSRESG